MNLVFSQITSKNNVNQQQSTLAKLNTHVKKSKRMMTILLMKILKLNK